MGLGRNSCQVFGFKGLTRKVFENQSFRLPMSPENGFGAVSRTVLVDGTPHNCPNQEFTIARARFEIHDGITAWFAEKSRGRETAIVGRDRGIPLIAKYATNWAPWPLDSGRKKIFS
jgi:hypothetical protein